MRKILRATKSVIELERLKQKNLHSSEAVARERLLKTQQAGKCLAGAVVICELWRLAVTP
jgi:hypothetical protein